MNSNHNQKISNHSLLQRTYGQPKPHRDYKRFFKVRKADTGQDPESGFLRFLKNDVIKPLHRSKPHFDNIKIINSDKWALNTQKKSPSIDKLPKIQQYKESFFPSKTVDQDENYRTSFIPTDHISINIPKIFKTEDQNSFLNLKKKFGNHTESTNKGWVPLQNSTKSLTNLSSVQYNILSPQEPNHSSAASELKILDKKLANRKKSIGEFYDLTMSYHPKINKDFRETCDSNKNIFHIRTGIFSHMYDNAHRNGNISVPFRNNIMTQSSPIFIKNK